MGIEDYSNEESGSDTLVNRAAHAIFVLSEAKKIRVDDKLMDAVRELIRERRDELNALADWL